MGVATTQMGVATTLILTSILFTVLELWQWFRRDQFREVTRHKFNKFFITREPVPHTHTHTYTHIHTHTQHTHTHIHTYAQTPHSKCMCVAHGM